MFHVLRREQYKLDSHLLQNYITKILISLSLILFSLSSSSSSLSFLSTLHSFIPTSPHSHIVSKHPTWFGLTRDILYMITRNNPFHDFQSVQNVNRIIRKNESVYILTIQRNLQKEICRILILKQRARPTKNEIWRMKYTKKTKNIL